MDFDEWLESYSKKVQKIEKFLNFFLKKMEKRQTCQCLVLVK